MIPQQVFSSEATLIVGCCVLCEGDGVNGRQSDTLSRCCINPFARAVSYVRVPVLRMQ